jgi:hypothetical protein
MNSFLKSNQAGDRRARIFTVFSTVHGGFQLTLHATNLAGQYAGSLDFQQPVHDCFTSVPFMAPNTIQKSATGASATICFSPLRQ